MSPSRFSSWLFLGAFALLGAGGALVGAAGEAPLAAVPAAASAPVAMQELGGNPPQPFHGAVRLGESFTYAARWNGFPIGRIHARVWPKARRLNGRPAAMLELRLEGNDFLSLFYPVAATMKSYVDLETGATLLFRRRTREGDYRADDRVLYLYDRRDALGRPKPQARTEQFTAGVIGKTQVKPLPGLVCDPLSLAWRLRVMPLKPGSVTPGLWVCDRYSNDAVAFRVGRGEAVDLPGLGRFPGLWLHPVTSGTVPGGAKVTVEGLCVQKDTHVILRAVITLPIGAITVNLVREDAPPPAAATVADGESGRGAPPPPGR